MCAHLVSDSVKVGGQEKEENAVAKEAMTSGTVSWEILGSWGQGVSKRKTRKGTVSCYNATTINSNKQVRFTESMLSRIR